MKNTRDEKVKLRFILGWSMLILLASLLVSVVPDDLLAQNGPFRVGPKSRQRLFKFQEGLLITAVSNKNPDVPQLEVFGRDGIKKLSLNILKSLEGAKTLAIWDMAIGKSGLLAVGAVATDASDRLAATLLIYDRSGQLQSAFAVPAEREVLKLAVDEQDNIWVLGAGSGDKAPEIVPMITKYNRGGEILQEFLPRSQFGLHAETTEQGSEYGGRVSFGLTKDLVWFWVPPKQLVTMRRDGSDIRFIDTNTPKWPDMGSLPKHPVISVEGCHLLPSGGLLANVWFQSDDSASFRLSSWDPIIGTWRIIPNPLYDLASSPGFLIGVENGEMAMSRLVKETNGSFAEVLWDNLPE